MSSNTPKQLGFQAPAEWEKHSAVWLAWPYDETTFPGRIKKVEDIFCQIIKHLYENEGVELLVLDEKMKSKAEKMLVKEGINISKISFHVTNYADVWLRDYGPVFIKNNQTHELAWIKFRYNAYGKADDPYFTDLLKDNQVFFNLRGTIDRRMFEPGFIMEGGAVEVNGQGALITTEQCLLNPNRNPSLTKIDAEKFLTDNLGVKKIIWLKEGLFNDHTDGHIDEIARFVAPNKIVCAYEDDHNDENFKILDHNHSTLQKATDQDGKPFQIIKLPMPHMRYKSGHTVHAEIHKDSCQKNEKTKDTEQEKAAVSYLNFYIGNSAVLMPTFKDKNDAKALEILQSLFPDRKVVPIDCTDIIYGGGGIHCMTQQQPT